MANNRDVTISDLPKEIFTEEMAKNLPDINVTAILTTLSNSNKHFHSMFKEEITLRAIKKLCQAIIDDELETIKRILIARPDLLLIDPPKNLVIESKLTWQRFYAEKPAIMLVKRKQIRALEFLDELDQTEIVIKAKKEAFLVWSPCVTRKNRQNQEEIVIPSEYLDYAKSLVDAFKEETFPNESHNYGCGMLSDKTESVLSTLLNRLMPEQAVKIDYFDVELFLLAIYKVYWDQFIYFKKWDQRDAFCVRVIGLVQSFLSPETGKIFCESLDKVLKDIQEGRKIEINKEAMSHRLKSGEFFYRVSQDARKGPGFNFFSGLYGITLRLKWWGGFGGPFSWQAGALILAKSWPKTFEIFMLKKNKGIQELLCHKSKPKKRQCAIM